jgi:hypothetical protein
VGIEFQPAAPRVNRGGSGRQLLTRAAGELLRFFIATVPWEGRWGNDDVCNRYGGNEIGWPVHRP